MISESIKPLRISPVMLALLHIAMSQYFYNEIPADSIDLPVPSRFASHPIPFPILSAHNLLYLVPIAIFLLIHTKAIPEIQPRIR
ncbi:unnamed protein product, partial [Mesorhabditis belari]|uniref:Uncharacterized protein n=1 Tax=Mesorhabditis belari TaxID=2138241 RepID=A0AAF3FQC7_9BILA